MRTSESEARFGAPDVTEFEDRYGRAPDAPFDRILWRWDTKFSPSSDGTARFIPYVNAEVVSDLLDQWVGPFGWRDHYEVGRIGETLACWCYITIAGITKEDVGVSPGGTDETSVKGLISDAFKRTGGLKWGAGRNVYRLPGVWAPCRTWEKNGRLQAAPSRETNPAIRDRLERDGLLPDDAEIVVAEDAHENDDPVASSVAPGGRTDRIEGGAQPHPNGPPESNVVAPVSHDPKTMMVSALDTGLFKRGHLLREAREIASKIGMAQPGSTDAILEGWSPDQLGALWKRLTSLQE